MMKYSFFSCIFFKFVYNSCQEIGVFHVEEGLLWKKKDTRLHS